MYDVKHIRQLPRISVIMNFSEQVYDDDLFKHIFDYGIIETYSARSFWKSKIDTIDYLAFKVILANPDEIYTFIQQIKTSCWKIECWLIRFKKPPKILYSCIKKDKDIIEEDFFWELEYELY